MAETGIANMAVQNSVFSAMEVAAQEDILRKTVIFQGQKTTMKDLLTPSRFVDFDEVIDSELLLKLDGNEEISIGAALNDNTPCHYIPRSFSNHSSIHCIPRSLVGEDEEDLSDERLCEIKENPWHQIVTICAPPGSGKSTVLDHVAVTIKKRYPHLWVIKVDLNDYTDALSEFKKNNMESVTVIDLLNSRPESEVKDGLERKIFSTRHKVVLLVDGLDEVCPDFEDIMKDVMSNYREHRCFAKVFVTSSKNLSEELQKECWSQNPLLALPRNDQVNLFVKYLERKLETQESIGRSKVFVKELVERHWSEEEEMIIGTPLKLKLLAEIYEEKIMWDRYYEFLTNDNSKSTRLKQISLTKLFLLFINKRYLKNELTLNENLLRNNIAKVNKECSHFLYIIALENIFPKERCKLFNVYKHVTTKTPEEIEERFLEMGIVKKANGLLRFFHRTVAEFFVAECIAEELRNSSNKEFLVFFINEILMKQQFTVIRSFFDNVISTYVNSIPDYTLKELWYIVSDSTIILFGLIKEGYVNIFNLVVKCLESANIDIDFNVLGPYRKTLLHAAISSDRSDLLESLVEKGVSVNGRDNTGRTALHDAVCKSNLSAVQFLVQHGAKVNCKDLDGRTPFHEAGFLSSVNVVEYLLAHGAVIDSKDKQDCTCLHEAAESGDLDKVKFLVENGADIDSVSIWGTPIFYAVRFGHVEVVKYLVEKGVNLTLRNKSGASVLHPTERWYHYDTKERSKIQQTSNTVDIFKTLIQNGADVNAVAKRHGTVLLSSIDRNDRKDLVELLIESGANTGKINDLLKKAINSDAVNIARYLVGKGANVNVHTWPNSYVRHNLDTYKFLVENGADVNAKLKGRWSGSLVCEALNHHCDSEVIRFLVEHGASTQGCLNLAGYRKDGALFKYLVTKGATPSGDLGNVADDIETLRYSLDKGIKVNMSRLFYNSAITGNLDIIRYVLDKGVDVNYRDWSKTALHEAVKYDHLHVVKFLLKRGARVDVRDVKNETPLEKALRYTKYMEIADLLLEYSSDGKEVVEQLLAEGHSNSNTLLFVVKHGVKVNIIEKPFNRSFSILLRNSNFNLCESLVRNNISDCKTVMDTVYHFIESKEDHLLDDIFQGNYVIEYLLERGLHVDVEVMEKYDFLTKMAGIGSLRFVKHLVERGVDVNRKDKYGNTALHRACSDTSSSGNSEGVIKYLLGNGADVNAENNDGKSVLRCAIERKGDDVCKYLIENGANDPDGILRVLTCEISRILFVCKRLGKS